MGAISLFSGGEADEPVPGAGDPVDVALLASCEFDGLCTVYGQYNSKRNASTKESPHEQFAKQRLTFYSYEFCVYARQCSYDRF